MFFISLSRLIVKSPTLNINLPCDPFATLGSGVPCKEKEKPINKRLFWLIGRRQGNNFITFL